MKKQYRSSEIQELAKVSKDQLINWIRAGIIVPDEDAIGRGTRRTFSYRNLVEAILCREFTRYKMETSRIKAVLEIMSEVKIDRPDLGRKVPFWKFTEMSGEALAKNYKNDSLILVVPAEGDLHITVRSNLPDYLQSPDLPLMLTIIDLSKVVVEAGG